jgi:hypothetical protein
MLSLALSGCLSAEQRQDDTIRYEQLHVAALNLATKVQLGEISREEAAQQLVQMEFMSSDESRKAAAQRAATDPIIASSIRP